MKALSHLSSDIKQYMMITANYWAFTLTDGALRMLVVLYFYELGYSPLDIAMLFVFYEVFGVITNLLGGWLGARIGLNHTMNIGLCLQILALSMLLIPSTSLTILWVMVAQAISGIAKDLNKMSAKSAIKILVPSDAQGQLYRWVATLTGSKNTLKGVGFFLGGALLSLLGFRGAVMVMACALLVIWVVSLLSLKQDLGKAHSKPKLTHILSKHSAVNTLSAARMFLFGSRDIWFVIALPVYLASEFEWSHWSVSSFFAVWIIAYGIIQTLTPKLTGIAHSLPHGVHAVMWAAILATIPLFIAIAHSYQWHSPSVLIIGLLCFAIVFAINSSIHSYLIISYAKVDGISLDVGFYYMANAMGRLIGTVLSGWLFQSYGLGMCLWVSTIFIIVSAVISIRLPRQALTSQA